MLPPSQPALPIWEQQQRRFIARPSYHEVVELREFNPAGATDKPASADRFGAFAKPAAYERCQRSMFPLEWFDSRPERTVANMVDADDQVGSQHRRPDRIGRFTPSLWHLRSRTTS